MSVIEIKPYGYSIAFGASAPAKQDPACLYLIIFVLWEVMVPISVTAVTMSDNRGESNILNT